MPFGWNMSLYINTKFLKPLHLLLTERFPHLSFNFYLDDVLISGKTSKEVQQGIDGKFLLFDEVGLSINTKKSDTQPS